MINECHKIPQLEVGLCYRTEGGGRWGWWIVGVLECLGAHVRAVGRKQRSEKATRQSRNNAVLMLTPCGNCAARAGMVYRDRERGEEDEQWGVAG